MKRFYPSSAAFMQDGAALTKYNSGCFRSILLKSHDVGAEDIPKVYMDAGAAAERAHEADLNAANILYTREVVIRQELAPDVVYSGRADFVLADGTVHEVKGHVSKSQRLDVIRKGIYNPSYLAQLVSYMIKLRVTEGALVCGYYERDGDIGPFVRQEQREFLVEIGGDGSVWVDSLETGHNVRSLLEHEREAARLLAADEVGARPARWNEKYGGPCAYCSFKLACDAYDMVQSPTSEFVAYAKAVCEQAPPRKEVVANVIKRKKGAA